ncbi:MAG: stage sporulation protein, partial [Pseudonocardiales bacterium]|nr:stage sporulation protein [Pseudonocardiales bacterium]
MRPNRRARRLGPPIAALATVTLVLGTVVVATLVAAPAGAATVALPAGSVTVHLRGNGHGHGMSQYGARGAAIAGLTATRILAFYYPGTSLVALGSSTVRVLVSGTGGTTTVSPQSGLFVTGVSGALPTVGISRYRLT